MGAFHEGFCFCFFVIGAWFFYAFPCVIWLQKYLDSLIFCGSQTLDDRGKYKYSKSNSLTLQMRKGKVNDGYPVAVGWARTKIQASSFCQQYPLSLSLSEMHLLNRDCQESQTGSSSLGIPTPVTFPPALVPSTWRWRADEGIGGFSKVQEL